MDNAKAAFRLAYNIICAFGAVACVLVWLGIRPGEVSPMTWPHWTWLILGLLLFTFSLYSSLRAWFTERRLSPSKTLPVGKMATDLSLQFSAPNTMPVAVTQNNVWRWYALRNIFVGTDAKTKKTTEAYSWTIFISFDNPITFKQIHIDGGGSILPRYEVKDSSTRTAVIAFTGDIVGITVNIRAI